jgi:hypothetical protein
MLRLAETARPVHGLRRGDRNQQPVRRGPGLRCPGGSPDPCVAEVARGREASPRPLSCGPTRRSRATVSGGADPSRGSVEDAAAGRRARCILDYGDTRHDDRPLLASAAPTVSCDTARRSTLRRCCSGGRRRNRATIRNLSDGIHRVLRTVAQQLFGGPHPGEGRVGKSTVRPRAVPTVRRELVGTSDSIAQVPPGVAR